MAAGAAPLAAAAPAAAAVGTIGGVVGTMSAHQQLRTKPDKEPTAESRGSRNGLLAGPIVPGRVVKARLYPAFCTSRPDVETKFPLGKAKEWQGRPVDASMRARDSTSSVRRISSGCRS